MSLRMYQAEIRQCRRERLDILKARLAECYKPLLLPVLEAAGQVLGVAPEVLRRSRVARREFLEARRVALCGEVFAGGIRAAPP